MAATGNGQKNTMSNPSSSPTSGNKEWDAKAYPYPVDYCDHFETPLRAYEDIAPIVDELFFGNTRTRTASNGKNFRPSDIGKKEKRKRTFTKRSDIRVYDPYYCNGQTALMLREELGYSVVHEKRDFYKDIEQGTIPSHDILITNPPYSDQHKKQCLDFCLKQLQTHRRPFCILMPNYVAARQYYRTALGEQHQKDDVIYLVPQTRYAYNHPEGAGKTECPFASLWFLGIGAENVQRIQTFWEKKQQQRQQHQQQERSPLPAELITSFEDLSRHPEFASCFQNKRPNPRRRQRKRKTASQQQQPPNDSGSVTKADIANSSSIRIHPDDDTPKPSLIRKKSKYRNSEGKRKKRRF